MTDKLKAAQTPLPELLRSVPADYILKLSTPNSLGFDTTSIPVGKHCHEAADAILALIKAKEDAEAIAFQWQNAAIDVTQKHDALQAEVERQETIVKSWLRANAPGGWIDDMRARVNAMESALKKIVNGRHCPAIGERLSDTEMAVVALDALAPGAAPKGEQE